MNKYLGKHYDVDSEGKLSGFYYFKEFSFDDTRENRDMLDRMFDEIYTSIDMDILRMLGVEIKRT
jgi:hypothetical protein